MGAGKPHPPSCGLVEPAPAVQVIGWGRDEIQSLRSGVIYAALCRVMHTRTSSSACISASAAGGGGGVGA